METIPTNIIPTNSRQAFKILDNMLTDEEKAEALSKSRSEFALDEHFGLGLWIRNNWIYANPDGELSFEHPDTVSLHWLEKYHDHLKRMSKK